MKVPGASLANVLSARGFDIATASRRARISEATLQDAVRDRGELSDEEIARLADELAVPVHALFARHRLPLFPPVDFRRATPGVSELAKGTLKAISFVEKLSSTFAALDIDVDVAAEAHPVKVKRTDEVAITLAKEWRKNWGLGTRDQLDFQDANKLYVSLREYVESLGVIVVHFSFLTDEAAGIYAKVADGPHAIVINTTRSSKARKCFTLAHEFCHFLLREEGVSNPSVLDNQTETFCNKFAAYLLAPDEVIREGLSRFGYRPSGDNDFIRLFAKKLGISQEALVRRLVEMQYLTKAQYGAWRAQFNGLTPPGDLGEGGGGQSDPLQVKRTKYGSLLLRHLAGARNRGDLDELDIYRLVGLKPKYQNELFPVL